MIEDAKDKRLRELEEAKNKLSEEKEKLVKEKANLKDRFNELEAKYSEQRKSLLTSALEQNLNFFKGVVNKIKSVKITKDFWPKLGAVVLGLVAIFEVCLLFKQTEIAKNQTDLMGVQNSMVQNQTALMDSQTNIMKFQNQMFGEQNKMVEKQTSMIDWQNRLFENQNLLVQAQNNRLDQQTYLQEAERRSALVFLMGNIFDEMNHELKDTSNKKKYLSQPLIRQIISLSHGLRPYKFLVNDELTDKEYSPERGQLLVALLNSNIDTSSLYSIFKKADFTSTYLNNTNLSSSIISYIDLSNSNITNSNMDDCKLDFSDLRNVNFSGSTLNSAIFERTLLMGANLCYTELSFAKLDNANLDGVLITKFSYMSIAKEYLINFKYSKETIKRNDNERDVVYLLKKSNTR